VGLRFMQFLCNEKRITALDLNCTTFAQRMTEDDMCKTLSQEMFHHITSLTINGTAIPQVLLHENLKSLDFGEKRRGNWSFPLSHQWVGVEDWSYDKLKKLEKLRNYPFETFGMFS